MLHKWLIAATFILAQDLSCNPCSWLNSPIIWIFIQKVLGVSMTNGML